MQPLRGLHLEGRRSRGRESARRFGLRRRPLSAVDLLHQEPLLLRRALVVPALPLAAEMLVELLAAICERDAVADALLRRATLERAASRTPHQCQPLLGPGACIGSNLRCLAAGRGTQTSGAIMNRRSKDGTVIDHRPDLP